MSKKQKGISIIIGAIVVLAAFTLGITSTILKIGREEVIDVEADRVLIDYLADTLVDNEQKTFRDQIFQTIREEKVLNNAQVFEFYENLGENNPFIQTEEGVVIQNSKENNHTSLLLENTSTGEFFSVNAEDSIYSQEHQAFVHANDLKAGLHISYLKNNDNIVWIKQVPKHDYVLKKCWINSSEDTVSLIYEGMEFVYDNGDDSNRRYDEIADVTVNNGAVTAVETYKDRVHGKLMSVTEENGFHMVELEDGSMYPLNSDAYLFNLTREEHEMTLDDLVIGYDFTDFVLDADQNIIAALVMRQEAMKNIRVLIKNTDFESKLHEEIVLKPDMKTIISTKNQSLELNANEEISISANSILFEDASRIHVIPNALSGKTQVLNLDRNQGHPSYRGTLDIVKTAEGLLLINELPLEEYLYSVVPSEMPPSYPAEALKAQAVSARTYAYSHMLGGGMQNVGAHVDDSVAFQVYNNLDENPNTTAAIRATSGEVLHYQGDLISTYFYSTSCGIGSDMTAWKTPGDVNPNEGYLQAQRINKQNKLNQSDNIEFSMEEDAFEAFIKSADTQDYESEETYYRWKYETKLDIEYFLENLKKRYEAEEEKVITLNNGFEANEPIRDFEKVYNLEIVKRANGMTGFELLIETDTGSYLIRSEKNIRYILAGANTSIALGKDYQKEGKVNGMLPSAFCVLELSKDEETGEITSYKVYGGGYGHGIGMSQNGAKDMASNGMKYKDILASFYKDTTLDKLK